jgi:hypothetical protein
MHRGSDLAQGPKLGSERTSGDQEIKASSKKCNLTPVLDPSFAMYAPEMLCGDCEHATLAPALQLGLKIEDLLLILTTSGSQISQLVVTGSFLAETGRREPARNPVIDTSLFPL